MFQIRDIPKHAGYALSRQHLTLDIRNVQLVLKVEGYCDLQSIHYSCSYVWLKCNLPRTQGKGSIIHLVIAMLSCVICSDPTHTSLQGLARNGIQVEKASKASVILSTLPGVLHQDGIYYGSW